MIPVTEDEQSEFERELDNAFGELQGVFDKIEQMRDEKSDLNKSYLQEFQDQKSQQWEKGDEESDEEYAQRWKRLHQDRKQKALQSINKMNAYIEMLHIGALRRKVGHYEDDSEEDKQMESMTENFDEAFQEIIKDCEKLLKGIGGYFDWESENLSWNEEIREVNENMNQEVEHLSSILDKNQFLRAIDVSFTHLKNYRRGTSEYNQPKLHTFLKSVLYHSILSIHGSLSAFFTYVMDYNKIEKIDDILEEVPEIDSVGVGGLELVKKAPALTAFEYSMTSEESEEINDIIQNLVFSMQGYSKMIEALPIGDGKYKPKLSDVNSHIATNHYRPRETYANLGMWPLERENRYQELVDLDMNNWLGSEWHQESIGCGANEHPVLYRDFLDFIQSIGYNFLKVSSYAGHRRKQPKLNVFVWGGEDRKYRSNAVIFFHNPLCEIVGTEMRIAIRTQCFTKAGEIECFAGLELLKEKVTSKTDQTERELFLREETENFVRQIFLKFDEYQKKHGLLKNAKFDAMISELNAKGRTFKDMILSESKKQLLDENIFAILSNSERLIERGVETNRGIMLAGPPGVGKSMTIDAIISDASCTVMFANFIMLQNDMEGIFDIARRYAPTILILEDIDALGITGQRGEFSSGAGLSTLLNCMDGINSNNGVITVATSNHPEQMDWALIARPGRFDVRIDYPYPNQEILLGILKLKLSVYPCEDDLDLDGLVKDMPLGFTGSHIHDIVNQANYISINNSSASAMEVKINQQALQSAIERSRYNFNKFLDERPHINLQNPPTAAQILLGDKEKSDYFG